MENSIKQHAEELLENGEIVALESLHLPFGLVRDSSLVTALHWASKEYDKAPNE